MKDGVQSFHCKVEDCHPLFHNVQILPTLIIQKIHPPILSLLFCLVCNNTSLFMESWCWCNNVLQERKTGNKNMKFRV